MYGQRNDKNSIYAVERISISDFLASLYPYSSMPKVRHEGEAMIISQQVNTVNNPQFRHIERWAGYAPWGIQKIDYVKSNLPGDRGFIFYFQCNGCWRKTKYLYFPSLAREPFCRTCCNLQYAQPNRRQRFFTRLLRKPYLPMEAKYMLMKRANITKEDIANYLSDNCKD